MSPRRGLQCPVLVSERVDWDRDYSSLSLGQLLAMEPDELATVDPVAMNLTVAKGIPSLAQLDIRQYQDLVNGWVADFTRRCLPRWEPYFDEAPEDFKSDIRYFRLGMVCQYLELEVGIEYNRDQRESQSVLYTDPCDIFLNGVLDTREGTCGNMAALHLAFGWRLGWPVSLACVNSHFVLRFDDGKAVYNIEATQSGHGGFKSDPDEYLIETKNLPSDAIESGSDLRALRPREVLGSFIGLRARHLQDVGIHEGEKAKILESEPDWLLARKLFPTNRVLYRNQMAVSSMRGHWLFESREAGRPGIDATSLAKGHTLTWRPRQSLAGQRDGTFGRPPPEAIDKLFSQVEFIT